MKKIIYTFSIAFTALVFTQCADWTTPEKMYDEPVNSNSEAYYEALREYKKTDHSICFGWFSGWTGAGTDMYNQLRGIPDSMDVVSIWGGKTGLNADQIADMREVQQKKGTKILWCQHVQEIGREITPEGVDPAELWGWNGSSYDGSDAAKAAIRKYAKAIVDSTFAYGYDGCDFDYEPNYGYAGNISASPEAMHIFLSEVAKYMGPTSPNPHMILAVDGEPQTLLPESGPLLDYYIIQAYYSRGYTDLDNRFQKLVNKFGSLETKEQILRKTVWCEDFERHKQDGGPVHTLRDGGTTYSLMGMAKWYLPEFPETRHGGVGAYRFNLCRPVNDYFFMRQVIQEMNPAQK